jgi:aerobic C4-dicarboxylate transport protein
VATVVVSRWEGQLDTERFKAVLANREPAATASPALV